MPRLHVLPAFLLLAAVAVPLRGQAAPPETVFRLGDRIRIVYCQGNCRRSSLTAVGRVQLHDTAARALHLDPDARLRLRFQAGSGSTLLTPRVVRDTVFEVRAPGGLRLIPFQPGWTHDDEALRIPLDRTTRVDARVRRTWLRGAARGLLIGGASAGLAGGLYWGMVIIRQFGPFAFTDGVVFGPSFTDGFVFGAVAGVVVGAPAGALVGAVVPGTRWEEVSVLPDSASEAVPPPPGR